MSRLTQLSLKIGSITFGGAATLILLLFGGEVDLFCEPRTGDPEYREACLQSQLDHPSMIWFVLGLCALIALCVFVYKRTNRVTN